MNDIMREFTTVAQNPLQTAQRWKEAGKQVIGCFPMYVPEELIHAAGVLPITVLGSDKPITLADKYMQPYICGLVRSNFDLALSGDLAFLDGMVFPDICESIQMVADIWNIHRPSPFHFNLLTPMHFVNSPTGKQYLMEQFNKLKTSLEEFTGQQITDRAIRGSIAIYNRNRKLLAQLYQARCLNPMLFRARDIATIVTASMLMPKEDHTKLLAELLKKTEGVQSAPNGKVRVIISGYLCDRPELDILDLIEESGAVIADDDLYVGRRYFQTLANEAIDPIESLAERYIWDVPCPTKINPDNDWADYLLNLVREAKAQGVIIVILKYCEPHSFDYPYLKKRLSQENVPHLMLETERMGASEQIRTRLNAFVEMIRR